ncbi:MAG TPA: hypothetical protein VF278_08765, partial [Pirellulales bacterium]
ANLHPTSAGSLAANHRQASCLLDLRKKASLAANRTTTISGGYLMKFAVFSRYCKFARTGGATARRREVESKPSPSQLFAKLEEESLRLRASLEGRRACSTQVRCR